MELGVLIRDMVKAYCKSREIAWDGADGGKIFFKRLQTEAMQNEVELAVKVADAMQRMWTSPLRYTRCPSLCAAWVGLRCRRAGMLRLVLPGLH